MKLRSLSREWRIRRAPRPMGYDRVGQLRKSQLHARDVVTSPVSMLESEIQRLYRRLEKAADKFWPYMDRDERSERVSMTVCEALDRARRDEKHTISWWAKFMWGRGVDKDAKNKEDSQDPAADDLWAGYEPARQELFVEAKQAIELCKLLPEPHRTAIFMRIDGANPIEIADEIKQTVDRVVDILSEARLWVSGSYLSTDPDVAKVVIDKTGAR